jgi:DnaJ-class molecular chaperone
MSNLYSLLGVEPNATLEQIKIVYRQLVLKYHPDRNKAPASEELFLRIKQAYQTLSNPEQRAAYDRQLNGPSVSNLPEEEDDEVSILISDDVVKGPSDFSAKQTNYAGKPVDLNIYATIDVHLSDLYNGAVKWLEVSRRVRCAAEQCSELKTRCLSCSGKRTITVKKRIRMEISACHEPPPEYRFQNQGDEALDPRMPPGDVIITPVLVEHTVYRRRGQHLIYDKQISAQDLLCGVVFELPSLDTRIWRFSLLDQVAQLGAYYVARGFGMCLGINNKRGDLLINIKLRLPRRLCTEREDWLASWQELNRDDKTNQCVALEFLSQAEHSHIFMDK